MADEKTDIATKIDDLSSLHDRGLQHFMDNYWGLAKENARMRRARHWTEEQETEHETQGRLPYSIPLLEARFNSIESQMMQTPYDIIADASEPGFEIQAEIKTQIFKHIEQMNDLMYVVPEWYRDGLVKCYGVLKRTIDYSENPAGENCVEKILYDHFIWDTNCKKYNVARYADWCEEFGYSTRDELKARYPDKKELIDAIPSETDESKTNQNTEYKNWYRTENKKELIKWVKHSQRKYKTVYKVTFNDGHTEDSDERPDFTRMSSEDRWQSEAQLGIIYPVSAIDRPYEEIEITVFSKLIKEPLEEKTEKTNLHRYILYWSNYDDGDFWTLADLLKHPQRFLDRLTSQIDASIGKLIKNSYYIRWENLLKQDQDRWNELSKQLVTGGAVLRMVGTKGGEKPIESIDGGNVPPELFTTWQYMVNVLYEVGGGKTSLGVPDANNSSQSGRYVEKMNEAAFAMAYLYIFNLGRSLKYLGEGLNEDINVLYGNNLDRIIDITDDDLDPLVLQMFQQQGMMTPHAIYPNKGFLKIGGGMNLGEARTKIIISRGEYTPTAKEKRIWQWNLINQSRISAQLPPYPIDFYGKDLGIDASVLTKAKAFDAKIEEQQARSMAMQEGQAKFNANMEMAKETREAAVALGDHNLQQKEIEQSAQKPKNE